MELSLWLCAISVWTLISELTAQTYDRRGKEYTTFPTNIPSDTTEIDLYDNKINSFPDDAFTNFDQLETLDIGSNLFTQMPKLSPVGDTLKSLFVWYCKLTKLNTSIFNELIVLERMSAAYCPLTSLPDVSGPGNTLRVIACYGCKVRTFPMLSNYEALKYITFGDDPMARVPEAAVASLHLSGKLLLYDTAITSLSDYPQAYENITFLRLDGTDVSFVLVSLNIVTNNENNIISYFINKYTIESFKQ